MKTRYYIDYDGNPWVTDGVNSIKLPVYKVAITSSAETLGCWELELDIRQVTRDYPDEVFEK